MCGWFGARPVRRLAGRRPARRRMRVRIAGRWRGRTGRPGLPGLSGLPGIPGWLPGCPVAPAVARRGHPDSTAAVAPPGPAAGHPAARSPPRRAGWPWPTRGPRSPRPLRCSRSGSAGRAGRATAGPPPVCGLPRCRVPASALVGLAGRSDGREPGRGQVRVRWRCSRTERRCSWRYRQGLRPCGRCPQVCGRSLRHVGPLPAAGTAWPVRRRGWPVRAGAFRRAPEGWARTSAAALSVLRPAAGPWFRAASGGRRPAAGRRARGRRSAGARGGARRARPGCGPARPGLGARGPAVGARGRAGRRARGREERGCRPGGRRARMQGSSRERGVGVQPLGVPPAAGAALPRAPPEQG